MLCPRCKDNEAQLKVGAGGCASCSKCGYINRNGILWAMEDWVRENNRRIRGLTKEVEDLRNEVKNLKLKLEIA